LAGNWFGEGGKAVNFDSARKALSLLVFLLCASNAGAQGAGLSIFDAAQFSGALPQPPTPTTQIVTSTTCSASGATLTCTSTSGTVQFGMIVIDVSNNTAVTWPTTISAIPSPFTTTQATAIHTGDNVEFIGQQINGQFGTSFGFSSGETFPANNMEWSEGTASAGASFAGPMAKFSKIENITSFDETGTGQCHSDIDNSCNAVVMIGEQSLDTNAIESLGLMVQASTADCRISLPTHQRTEKRATPT